MSRRSWAFAVALLGITSFDCNALRKVDECTTNLDCARGTMCAVDESYCRSGGPIAIGYLAGVTGTQATVTEQRRVALEFGRWIIERDPARKVLGRGLEFRLEDTLGTVPEVTPAGTRLLDQNVAAMIGPGPSAEVLEAQKLTAARRILHLAPSAAAPPLGDAQPADLHQRFLFQMVLEAPQIVPTIPLFLSAERRPPSFDACLDGLAIVASEDTVGPALKKGLEDVLAKNCVKVTASLTVPPTKKSSYASEVDALLAAQDGGRPTRCLFLATQTDVAGELLRALKARQQATPSRPPFSAFIGSGTLNSPAFFTDAKSASPNEPSLAEGFYGIDADGTPDRAEFRDLEALWQEYVPTQSTVPPGTPFGTNRGPYAEAVIVLALAIELAGTVEDPIALRDAFLDVTSHEEGDRILGPKDIGTAFALIRAARKDGRRAAIDYRSSYSNLDFDARGFVRTGTMVWAARSGELVREMAFTEEQVLAATTADPGPACR